MSKLLYNGVELPPVPAHDADATVEVISAVLPAALSMYAQSPYILVIGKGTLWQGGKCYVRGVSAVYRLSGDAWMWHYGSGTVSAQDIVAANYFEAIWTNTDIPTADGAGIYLAASAPVDPDAPDEPEPEEPPVEPNVDVAAIYRRGWMDGFLSGINIRGLLRRRKVEEPQPVTAYLYGTPSPTIVTYNGVELPELPEWDRSIYPYAYFNRGADGAISLMCTTAKINYGIYFANPEIWVVAHPGETVYILKIPLIESSWGDSSVITLANTSADKDRYGTFNDIFWCNTDIPNIDTGTTYLAASEPVYSQVGGNVALADGDGYVMYNGAVLPPLPEWDKQTYPYAVIVYSEPVSQYNLHFYVNPPSLSYGWWDGGSNSLVQTPSAPYIMYRLPESESEWQGDGKPITYNAGIVTPITPDGVTVENGAYKFVWTNTDIYAENDTEFGELAGTLFYASSDPIPLASSEPVAAVYGDIKMPVLPAAWNKYPYRMACYFAASATDGSSAMVNAFATEPYTVHVSNLLSEYDTNGVENGVYVIANFYRDIAPDKWNDIGEETSGKLMTNTKQIFWANYDVHASDGSVYLAASEPIPIYEKKE